MPEMVHLAAEGLLFGLGRIRTQSLLKPPD